MTQANSKTGFGVGASLKRKEDARHLHGRGQFVSDVRLPNTQDVAFVRSPHAHARIKGIVLPPHADGCIFTARDLPRLAEMRAVPQVSGFKVRPEGSAYAMDLAEDVITVGPTGEAVPGLQQKEVERLRTPTTLEQGAIANFTTKLTLSGDSAPGRYTVRLTIRDQVGGAAKTHEVAFDLP